MSTIASDTVHRLLKDVRQIMKNPLTDNGIYYVHSDSDMLKGYAMIVGPSDTPYFGGFYFFEFNYPSDYPYSPPKVTYHTNGQNIRFNPNLYKCGKVCISILNTWSGEQWTSCQTISTILLTLCTILCSNPLLNEPGVNSNHADVKQYNEIIQWGNMKIAICEMINKKEGVYNREFFDLFYPFMKENFFKNYDSLLEIAKKKNNDLFCLPKIFFTGFYSMRLEVDYNNIIANLQIIKEMLSKNDL
jgi:ubiquitin-protein ligase